MDNKVKAKGKAQGWCGTGTTTECDKPWRAGQGSTEHENDSNPYSGVLSYGDGNGANQNSTDNDAISNVDGDDNSVIQKVDNSVFSQSFGGDSRSFTYNGGMGEGGVYDSPVSAATMGGFYAPKDGPAEAAKFMASYIGSNKLHQRESNKSFFNDPNTDFNHNSDVSRAFNHKEMQKRLDEAPQLQRDRATVGFGKLFGDPDSWFKNSRWTMPKPGKPIESDVKDIAEDYKDELD